MKEFGIVALVGAPNSGKSTLVNQLLGQKLSIVSNKPQTTRNSIKAILIEGDKQLITIDTPGLFIPRENKLLERIIVKSAWQTIRELENICFLVDATKGLNKKDIDLLIALKKEIPNIIIVINKIDLIKKNKILNIIKELTLLDFDKIYNISALTGDGLKEFKEMIFSFCKAGQWMFDEENITDAPMTFTASEITREKIFNLIHEEIPYSITVKTDLFKKDETEDRYEISQTIYVNSESHKKIIVGKNGSMIKQIGMESRIEISKIMNSRIYLKLFVKVKENWMNNIEYYEKCDIGNLPKNNSLKYKK